jgi:hypothetical protein
VLENAIVGGVEDGAVDLFGEWNGASLDFVVCGEGEFLAGSDAEIDAVEFVDAMVEDLEWLDGDVEVEAAFGARFGDLLADVFVGAGAKHLAELVIFVGGEWREGGLRAEFAVCFHDAVRG